jgi:hypothetical protein
MARILALSTTVVMSAATLPRLGVSNNKDAKTPTDLEPSRLFAGTMDSDGLFEVDAGAMSRNWPCSEARAFLD